MKVVRSSKALKFENSPVCTAFEYHTGDKDIDGAVVELKGRYPDKGRILNTQCKELVYILSGSVVLELEGEKIALNQGDEVLILPNEKYYWDGNCKMFLACNPAWYSEQHVEVE